MHVVAGSIQNAATATKPGRYEAKPSSATAWPAYINKARAAA